MARPRKPTAQKKLEGTDRPDRANPAEPKYRAVAPAPPADLSAAARRHWHYLVPKMAGQRVLTLVDRGALASYCNLAARRDRIAKLVNGLPNAGYYKSQGLWKRHPAVGELLDLEAELRQLAGQLGITPATRSKVSAVDADAAGDPMAPTARARRPRAVAGADAADSPIAGRRTPRGPVVN